MQSDNLLKQVSFIKEIDKLKYVQRKTKLFNSDRHENDAEHSWHLAMMTIVLAEHADKPIDVLKVLKMVLIHDIVEIDAGDTFIYDTLKNHTNTDAELMAAKRIFGLLPSEQAEEFIAIGENLKTVSLMKRSLQNQWTGLNHCCKILPIKVGLGWNSMCLIKKFTIRKKPLKRVRQPFGTMQRT